MKNKVYWIDPGTVRYAGKYYEDIAGTVIVGTCPGHRSAVIYDESSLRQSGGGKGALIQKDKSGTLATNNDQTVFCHSAPAEYEVRRLTPTECARLQGFPDWWCEGIPHSEAAEYKMWGNGMALPCALYVMEGCEDYFNRLNAEEVQRRNAETSETDLPSEE